MTPTPNFTRNICVLKTLSAHVNYLGAIQIKGVMLEIFRETLLSLLS